MNNDCQHSFTKQKQTKIVDDKQFIFEADTCVKCGLYIWDERSHQKELEAWIKKDNVKIVVQCRYSDSVLDAIQEVSKIFNVDESKVFRASLSLYIRYMQKEKMMKSLIKLYRENNISTDGKKEKKKNVRVSIMLFNDLNAFALHEGLELPDFIRQALLVVLSPIIRKQKVQGLEEDFKSILMAA